MDLAVATADDTSPILWLIVYLCSAGKGFKSERFDSFLLFVFWNPVMVDVSKLIFQV